MKRGACVRLALVLCLGAAPALAGDRPQDSALHSAGELLLPVTNTGLIGALDAGGPSARWPGPMGIDHLRMGALWIGARIAGIPRLSTSGGGFGLTLELQPGSGPLAMIYEGAEEPGQGDRYPYSNWDGDSDGLEDEDPPDGLDNDGDGLVDEDGATISDQMLSSTYRDDLPECYEHSPDHWRLGAQVYQESYQWVYPPQANFVGLRTTVVNVSEWLWEDFYSAWYADWLVLLDGQPGDGADDRVGYFAGPVALPDGGAIAVQIAFAYEASGDAASYAGIALLDHPVDPVGIVAPTNVSPRSFSVFTAGLGFEEGGEPTNDEQCYAVTSAEISSLPPAAAGDYSTLLSAGPFRVAPGDSVTCVFALVAGASEEELLTNAALAAQLYRGQDFDRDGDPDTGTNGREFTVHWYPHPLGTTAELAPGGGGQLSITPNPSRAAAQIRLALSAASPVTLRIYDCSGRLARTLLAGVPHGAGELSVQWDGHDEAGLPLASGVYLVVVEAEGKVATGKLLRLD